MSIDQMLSYIREQLVKANIEEPALEARLFLEKATGYDNTGLIINGRRELTEAEQQIAAECLRKKLSGIPTAYILGYKEFYGLELEVNENVLIPRPDTETLVETALSFLRSRPNPNILDLCTGSGCVGIATAYEAGCTVTLADISPAALRTAVGNAERYISGRYTAVETDLFSNIPETEFDAILSNPPYLTDEWYTEVTDEVRKEPYLAFPGFGEDGLDIIRKLVAKAPDFLLPGGLLALECDYRQSAECANILKSSGFVDVSIEKDLSGRDRVVRGVKRCTNS